MASFFLETHLPSEGLNHLEPVDLPFIQFLVVMDWDGFFTKTAVRNWK